MQMFVVNQNRLGRVKSPTILPFSSTFRIVHIPSCLMLSNSCGSCNDHYNANNQYYTMSWSKLIINILSSKHFLGVKTEPVWAALIQINSFLKSVVMKNIQVAIILLVNLQLLSSLSLCKTCTQRLSIPFSLMDHYTGIWSTTRSYI